MPVAPGKILCMNPVLNRVPLKASTASMSTTLAGSTGLPSDAIDGLTHTAWDSGPNGEDCAISAQNDASPWLMIDLKKTVSVQEVKVYGRSESAAARETSTSLTYTLGVPTRTSAAEGRICTEDLIGGYVRYCESGRT